MCQTLLISNMMQKMGHRTYMHRMEVATPNTYRVSQLSRLNRDLDTLYELVYSQWRTVTEADYNVFGGQFKLLLETIKGLYSSCRKAPKKLGLKEETKKLGMNYSALYELNSDIVNFRIKTPSNSKLQQALARLAEVDSKM